jgi:integrase/recombinase XerD
MAVSTAFTARWSRQRKNLNCDFNDLRKELIARKYSNKTIKAYMYYNRDLVFFSGRIPSEITNTDIVEYLVYLAENKNVATATMNQAINALKFYYGSMLKKSLSTKSRDQEKIKSCLLF